MKEVGIIGYYCVFCGYCWVYVCVLLLFVVASGVKKGGERGLWRPSPKCPGGRRRSCRPM